MAVATEFKGNPEAAEIVSRCGVILEQRVAPILRDLRPRDGSISFGRMIQEQAAKMSRFLRYMGDTVAANALDGVVPKTETSTSGQRGWSSKSETFKGSLVTA
jgi:hypothetical protein